MDWWNDVIDWFGSAQARPVYFASAVLLVAVIVSGLLAALIARGAVRGMLARSERAQKASAIAALVDAATEASVWNSLTPQEQVLSDRAVGQADIQVRLLPIRGAGAAANWAAHQLAEMKRNSATYGYQLDPVVAEFRDRLVEWQNKPGRARKVFQGDLERWSFDTAEPQRNLTDAQDAWVAERHHERHTPTAVMDAPRTIPSPTPADAPSADAAPVDSAETAAAAPESGAAPEQDGRPEGAEPLGADTQTQKLIDDVEAIDARGGGESTPPKPPAAPGEEHGRDDSGA